MAEFPATDLLGYSINMTAVEALDTRSAMGAVQTSRRIIDFDEYDTRNLNVDGKAYKVPKSIGVTEGGTAVNSFVHYPSGNDAVVAFANDPSLASRFVSITGDSSIRRATEKLYRRNLMYAYYSFGRPKYYAALNDYANLLNISSLKTGVKDLPAPFNGENKDVLDKYKSFFQRYGTHVITTVQSGSQYQLHLWSPNLNTSVNPNWATNITADYDGIPNEGAYNPTIRNSDQYKLYLNLVQRIQSLYGGDNSKSQALIARPTWSNFQAWVATSDQNTSVLSFVVDNLWSLMKNSGDDEMIKAAPRIEEAFYYIVDHPRPYKTKVSLTVESDWAEFGLLTPCAVVIKGENVPPMTKWDETKLMWGKQYSHEYFRQTLVFYVVNDGYPVDFYISHGSNGGAPGKGKAYITMEGATYKNEELTDNVYNTKWFYQAGVTGTPESFRASPVRMPNSGIGAWDSTLTQYLHEIGEEPFAQEL